MDLLDFQRRGIIVHFRLTHHGELHIFKVLNFFQKLRSLLELVLSLETKEVQVVSVENNLPGRIFLNEINVLCRNMRTVQIRDVNHILVSLHPVPDIALHLRTVKHLDSEFLQGGGIGFLMEEVIPEEFHDYPFVRQHFQVLIGRF